VEIRPIRVIRVPGRYCCSPIISMYGARMRPEKQFSRKIFALKCASHLRK